MKAYDVNDTWGMIETWCAENAPAVFEGLNGPASEEAIVETERELEVQFPVDFRSSLLIHDGQADGSPWMIYGWELLSLERIQSERSVWKSLLDSGDFDGVDSDADGEFIRTDWWHNHWVPITYSGSGDHHVLDLAPAADGQLGQIFRMWHDDGERLLMGNSFSDFLARYASALQSGDLVYAEDYEAIVPKQDV